jgi:hypothetical protein
VSEPLLRPGEPIPTADSMAPMVLLPGWRKLNGPVMPDGQKAKAWQHKNKLTVIMSVEDRRPGGIWWHISIAHPLGLPSWEQLVEVKEAFMGKEVKAMHLLPPRSQWMNVHPHCMHLWVRLDGDTYPDELIDGSVL